MLIKGKNYSFRISERAVDDMDGFLSHGVSKIPSRVSRLNIAEYSTKRNMPAGSPRPGPWENEYTPYLVEPMMNMSPQSAVQREIILKAAQGGWTAAAENVLCYYMDETPADILFMSAGDDILERWATRRLEPAIDSFGIRENLVVSYDSDTKSKKTGDKTFSKDYYGGRLDMASSRSASKQRATDKRILVRDEIDGVKAKLATGEGYWLDVSWARTNSWEDRRKVMDFGTPTTYDESEIWKAYLLGDQRKFYVPCPHCQKFQVLEFGDEKSQHGVKPIYEAGLLKDAVYVCEFCHEPIKNSQKRDMMNLGYWEATTKTSEAHWVSRHWSSCYSPVLKWRSLYSHYERAREKPDGMRSFVNLYLGLPYKETGVRLSKSKLISLKSTYSRGTVPEGVLFTTVAADVQEGSKSDPKNPPRIELEVCGHGKQYRTWSVDYFRIEGAIDNAFSGAWQELFEKFKNKELTFKNGKGVSFDPVRTLIDSGFNSHVVYEFAQRLKNVYASKGEGQDFVPDVTLDKRKKNSDFRYKVSKHVTQIRLYIIATNEYKRIMRSALRVVRSQTSSKQPPMFCEFPIDYENSYFDMLNAEEMLDDGSFESHGRRNEATDCRTGNMCASESWLSDSVERVRESFREKGYSQRECLAITKEHILAKLEKKLARKSA